MLAAVGEAVDQLRRSFEQVEVEEDGVGGAYVFVGPAVLGEKFSPSTTWFGGHITAQFPYADIYPLFVSADIKFADGRPFTPPITSGHSFRGRPALQISRRTNRLDPQLQTALIKFQKVLHWLRHES